MRTAIISDLHLGAGGGGDLLRRETFRAPLLEALEPSDRVILLGDLIELRDRPIAEAFALARPFLRELTEAVPDGALIVVPGNHDHHLVEPWLERRLLEGEPPLGLEQRVEPEATPLATLARELSGVSIEIAYPGIWLRDDVYATHGHYLDRHLTVPTFERLGVAAVERLLGVRPSLPDPLEPPVDTLNPLVERAGRIDPITYEHAQSPVYALLFALAQGTGGERGTGNPSMRIWNAVGAGDTASAKLRGWLLGSVAVPGAVTLANRLGLGPVRSDLSPGAITRAGLAAMREVIERLGIDAAHVIFGHTHRRGPLGSERGWDTDDLHLWNTGSWLHSPTMLASTADRSPYWPGTVCFLTDEGEPELRHLLDDLSRDDLASGEPG